MVFVIGLTGGIGSGKTAVSDRFEALGITLADADVASRSVVEPGKPALQKVIDHFGPAVLDASGRMDRAAIRKIVFADATERKWLESVTVPAILGELKQILDTATSPYAMLMLSSGNGQSPWVHRHLVVDVPTELQVNRVMARDNNSKDQVEAIMKTQSSREQRLAYADDIIVNDAGLEKLDTEVNILHEKYLSLATAKPQL